MLYIIIALVGVKTSKYLSKTNEVWNKARGWKKIHNSYVSFDIVTFAIYGKNNGNMVVSEYQNFFSFQNVTYAYPPYAVNVPFISSHIKVSRSSLDRIYQHDCFTFYVGFFWWFFFTWSWIEVFFKEILLVIRNFLLQCLKLNWFSDKLSVGAADLYFQCSYLKNCIWCKFSINIFM